MKKVNASSQTATQGAALIRSTKGSNALRAKGSRVRASGQRQIAPSTRDKRIAAVAQSATSVTPTPEASVETKRPAGRRTGSRSAVGLTAAQLRELEKKLQTLASELKEALDGKAGSFNLNTMNESIIKGDDAEVAEKQRMSNAALQELDFLKSRLKLVQRALVKVSEGVYGLCEETEEPIGYERLAVVPWARYAVHVQEMRERTMRDYKVSRLRSES